MTTKMSGKHTNRLTENPLEKAFADAWAKQANDTLPYLLGDGNSKAHDLTDRDQEIAATIIQWLGSPVGQQLLREVFQTNAGHKALPFIIPKGK